MDEEDIERRETQPLLVKSCSSKSCEEQHRDADKGRNSRSNLAPLIILGFECLEATAFYGVSTNLVVYLQTIFHESTALSAANASTWVGTCFLAPLAGAVLGDAYWGNHKTVLISTVVYLFGMVLVALTDFVPSFQPSPTEVSLYQGASFAQNLALFSGLYLVAIGSGGVKSALLPLGAQQFNDNDQKQAEDKEVFFQKFYVCMTSGILTSGIFIVWIQENIGWAVGYSITTVCIATALASFIIATPAFQTKKPTGTPLKSILQVLVSSFRKTRIHVPLDSSLLFEIDEKECENMMRQKLEHTDGFRFLDKAAVISDSDLMEGGLRISWNLCTVTQVEELKVLLRLLPIWATGILFSAAYSQMSTTFIQQGALMNNEIGSVSVPPASLSSMEVIFVMFWVIISNNIIGPITRRCSRNGVGLSQLQRMGVGRFLVIMPMMAAGFLESRRLENANSGKNMSIAWQLPQYFFLAAAEVFNYITQLEFFYSQAPEMMKCMCISFALLTISLGNYTNSFIIGVVSVITSSAGNHGWLPDNLNEGHLDYFYYCLAGLCAVNFAVYVMFARNYTLKKVIIQ